MKTLLTILIMANAVWMMTACGSTTQNLKLPQRVPPAALTASRPDLPPALDGHLDSIFRNSLERSALYYDCQARHRALTEWAMPDLGEAED